VVSAAQRLTHRAGDRLVAQRSCGNGERSDHTEHPADYRNLEVALRNGDVEPLGEQRLPREHGVEVVAVVGDDNASALSQDALVLTSAHLQVEVQPRKPDDGVEEQHDRHGEEGEPPVEVDVLVGFAEVELLGVVRDDYQLFRRDSIPLAHAISGSATGSWLTPSCTSSA
jgi:hypothetical protein